MPDNYVPPQGPPPRFQSNNPFSSNNPYLPPSGPPPGHQQEQYVPPVGPPPSHQQEQYSSPSGPPPSRQQDQYNPPVGPPPSRQQEQYIPPSGPPPSRQQDQYAPPSGPPPGYGTASQKDSYLPPPGPPPPQHDWQSAVPDTSELPPPPSLFSGYDRSPANNANISDANAAENWLKNRPLARALDLAQPARDALHWGNIALIRPPVMNGSVDVTSMGHWHVKTKNNSPDSILVSSLPLYSANAHSPAVTEVSKTIYFEVKILSRRPEVTLGLGFVALPYPPFRLPGWERASLGVHGDDGHRYVNDKWGGRDFTAPFKPGETVGIGMKFSPKQGGVKDAPPSYSGAGAGADAVRGIDTEVFFTRNGKRDGGWDMHEELDAKVDLPITGLEGGHDLWAAVGTFDDVEFEVIFPQKDWLYKP